MKKSLMSVITVCITVITIGCMYVFTNELVNDKNLSKNELPIKEVIENKKEENINNKINKNQDKESKQENEQITEKSSKDKTLKESQDNKETLKPSKENNINEIEKEKFTNVFKVNKHTLLQNLPMKDKIKLLYMCRSLSTIDMGSIKEYMKSSNEIEASAEIFKILRQRLPNEDYKEIRNILDPYVNIEYIESNM